MLVKIYLKGLSCRFRYTVDAKSSSEQFHFLKQGCQIVSKKKPYKQKRLFLLVMIYIYFFHIKKACQIGSKQTFSSCMRLAVTFSGYTLNTGFSCPRLVPGYIGCGQHIDHISKI